MTKQTLTPLALGIGASLLLHGIWIWRLTAPVEPPVPAPALLSPIEVSVWAQAPEMTVAVAVAALPGPHRVRSEAMPARRALAPTASSNPSAPAVPAHAAVTAEVGVPPDLSAAAAAQSMSGHWRPSGAASVCASPSRPAATDCATQAPASAEIAAPLQRELQALGKRAPRAHAAPPELRRQSDGSYHHEAPRFTARIDRDGHVTLQDRPVLQSALPIPIAGTFDLTDAVEKHILNREIYTPQKRRFMEATAALRTQLSDRDREQSFSAGRAPLLAELERIVADQSLSPTLKRGAVFELWDSCASDEAGTRGQHITEAFIRQRMPAGSPLGYGQAELTALNQQRASARRFDPYQATRTAAAGGSAG